MATDSASTLIERTPAGQAVVNAYNNANKVFNLRKGLPIGAITWGSGSIGTASISTLAKDLRRRLSGKDPVHKDWELDKDQCTILGVAERLRQFMFDELYTPAFQGWPEPPFLGFIVAGYSAGKSMAEEYSVVMHGQCSAPQLLRPLDDTGVTWNGEPEAITRLLGLPRGLVTGWVRRLGRLVVCWSSRIRWG